jgi:hypothetical protein
MSLVSPEQIDLLIRLEGIFMPYARKQRDDAHKNLPDGVGARFVHYTSASNLISILGKKRLWMRNTNCMDDFREVSHGYDILHAYFADNGRRDAFIAAFDMCAPGAATEAIGHFNGWFPDIRNNTYISSVSEHLEREDLHGRLSMWRAFGNSPARVAFVFRVPKFSGAALAMNLNFSPVAYLTEAEIMNNISEVMLNVQNDTEFLKRFDRQIIVNYIFTMLLLAVTCLKHEGFREEREWRVFYSPGQRPSPLIESTSEVVGGVPQIVYQIPLDKTVSPDIAELDIAAVFDRLIIGPTQYPIAMIEAFTKALTAAGVVDARSKIFPSLIPIRT